MLSKSSSSSSDFMTTIFLLLVGLAVIAFSIMNGVKGVGRKRFLIYGIAITGKPAVVIGVASIVFGAVMMVLVLLLAQPILVSP
jgi:hypothetical protein